MSVKARPPIDRFMEKVLIDASGCWLWTGAKKAAGYGNFMVRKGHIASAHRVSWELHKGQIPDGLWILHRCDNPSCVNPDHLFPGTPKENSEDMCAKGRARGAVAGGEFHPQHKLTDTDVVSIRALRADGLMLKEIASRFAISEGHTSYLCSRTSRKTAEERLASFGVGQESQP